MVFDCKRSKDEDSCVQSRGGLRVCWEVIPQAWEWMGWWAIFGKGLQARGGSVVTILGVHEPTTGQEFVCNWGECLGIARDGVF